MAAVEWWERAGNGDSLMKAAQTLLLKDPSLPPVNFSRVLHLFRRSANTGHAPAATYLGNYYENLGQRGEALPWYLKAARQGDLEARRALERIEKAHKSMKDTLLEEDEDTKEDIEEQEL